MSLITEGQEKITKAKTKLVLKHPFFSILALGALFRNSTEVGMPYIDTMATDGKHIWWHEEFVDKHTVLEITGVIAHETLHIAFLHCLRRGARHPLLWNIACDHAINHIVLDAGLTLPKDHIYDPKYKNWLVDAIYDDLAKQAKKIEDEWGMGNPCEDGNPGPGGQTGPEGEGKRSKKRLWGMVTEPRNEDGTPMSDAEQTELQEEIKIKVVQAAEAAKSVGNLPVALEGLIKAIGKPVVNWREYIQNWVSGKTPDDYTWKRPNRKLLGLYNVLAPSMQLNGAGIGVISIDTSGSVSNEELVKYITEIVGVVEICNPEKVYIIQHDAEVHGCLEWEPGDTFSELKVTHRGGTAIKPSFKHAATKIDEEINWMICFTDMGIMDYPTAQQAPDFPVLWAATGPDNAPFGTYISLRDPIGAAS